MRRARGFDDADVRAARPLAVDGAVELHLETNEATVVDRRSTKHVELRAHDLSSTTSTLE
jgi:hypothetical protein